MDERFLQGRHFLKSNWHLVKEIQSDQSKGLPPPLQEMPPAEEDSVVLLPQIQQNPIFPDSQGLADSGRAQTLYGLLKTRQSRRNFEAVSLDLPTLSFLLWSCEGVRENRGKFSFRTTPSGGARHPLDVYVFARRIEGLKPGLYRYLPLEHSLVVEREGDDSEALDKALMGQLWNSACVILWAAVPYRSEWRYGKAADKLVALDAGHSCQNLYLACEALGLGTCAVGAYDQRKLDDFMGLDGEDMFALYAAPVGRPVK
ncbi:MAG: SagB-type dehydrogenase domain-containing protein [Spirochaetes bacterium]|nr:MAG: SagB-type dehydrogenase domain-containing protein [Spirochaetota bacterium]